MRSKGQRKSTFFEKKVWEMFVDSKINHTFAPAIRKKSNNKGLIR
jgi:hypothetical protein